MGVSKLMAKVRLWFTDSKANTVRYYFAIKEYLKKHPAESVGSDVMVAFSGTVTLDGVDYTEAENLTKMKKEDLLQLIKSLEKCSVAVLIIFWL